MTRARMAILCLLAGLGLGALVGCGSGGSSSASSASSRFVGRVDNPYFPLAPGTTYRYRGTKDGTRTIDIVHVTSRQKTILGAPCTVVSDRLFEAGRLAERTRDWYAQDRSGTVWYFGEATAELNRAGKVVSTEGSWEAGADGARAGILMPASPRPGQSFSQEHYSGHAEDHFRVLSLDATVTVPAGTYRRALLTMEWTPLEPGVIDHKHYVRGIGNVNEETVRGPHETSRLVAIERG